MTQLFLEGPGSRELTHHPLLDRKVKHSLMHTTVSNGIQDLSKRVGESFSRRGREEKMPPPNPEEAINKTTRQPTEREKIAANDI